MLTMPTFVEKMAVSIVFDRKMISDLAKVIWDYG
jgi:hypothetical protein